MPQQLSELDLRRRAFDAVFAEKVIPQGIRREPRLPPWWDCWERFDADSAVARDESAIDIIHFEATRSTFLARERAVALIELAAVPLATVGPHNAAVPSAAGLQPFDTIASNVEFISDRSTTPLQTVALEWIVAQGTPADLGPPESLFLAVRAAREALHVNPDDGLAHSRLARAYRHLQQQTIERELYAEFRLLEQLRKVQTVTALKRATRLRPDLQTPHELLGEIFLADRAFDLALPHVQAQLRLNKAAGPLPHESPADFAARIEQMSTFEQQLGKQVRDLLNLADTQSFELGVYGKARYAESNGLPGYALKQLLDSNYVEFGREGALLELYLLLHAGRTDDFRTVFDPTAEQTLGTFNHHWLETLLAAADGNYEQADDHLRQLVESAELPIRRRSRSTPAWLDGLRILTRTPNNPLQLLWQARSSRLWLPDRQDISQEVQQQIDMHCLRGMLALESGDILAARRAFDEGLRIWDGEGGAPRLGRHYLRLTSSPDSP
jgi:hypothetical protein